MDKQTTYTFTAYNASVHFCIHDAEIIINDHAGGEVISIEGINQRDLHGAIINYVQNLALHRGKEEAFVELLKGLRNEVEKAVARMEGQGE